jgi:hypothetical protein
MQEVWSTGGRNLSPRVKCECEALATLRHTSLGHTLLDPEDGRSPRLGRVWNFGKGTGLPSIEHQIMGHKHLGALEVKGLEPRYYSIL